MAFLYNQEFKDKIAGSGLSFSKMFDINYHNGKGVTRSISGEEKINESIFSILSTRVGERFFLPEYGSMLHTLIFEQNTLILHDMIGIYIRQALGKWEKRIEIEDIIVGKQDDSNTVPVNIIYRIVNSNVIGSYVYPFTSNQEGLDVYSLGGDVNSTSY